MKSSLIHIIYRRSFTFFLLCIVNMHVALAQTKKEIDDHKRKWDTPEWTDTVHNPYVNNVAITDTGKVLYSKICAVCHGSGGKGDGVASAGLTIRPANHTSVIVQSQTDGSLFYELSNGHNPMPAYKDILTQKQRWGLINYIRVLGKKTKTTSSNK